MTRILRVKNLLSPKTPRGVQTGDQRSGPSFGAEARKRVTSKASVRRLMAKDPASVNTRDIVDQFTNNANPKYDPSKAPGSVKVLDSTPVPPKRNPNAGHQNVIKRTLFNQNAGKTLKRR